jgi:hypothetical protein
LLLQALGQPLAPASAACAQVGPSQTAAPWRTASPAPLAAPQHQELPASGNASHWSTHAPSANGHPWGQSHQTSAAAIRASEEATTPQMPVPYALLAFTLPTLAQSAASPAALASQAPKAPAGLRNATPSTPALREQSPLSTPWSLEGPTQQGNVPASLVLVQWWARGPATCAPQAPGLREAQRRTACPVLSATQVPLEPPVGRGVCLLLRTAPWGSWHHWGLSAVQSAAACPDMEVSTTILHAKHSACGDDIPVALDVFVLSLCTLVVKVSSVCSLMLYIAPLATLLRCL